MGIAAGIGTLTAASYSARWWLVLVLATAGVLVGARFYRRLMPRGISRALPGQPAALAARICAMAAFNGADFFIPLAARRFHGATPTMQSDVVGFSVMAAFGGAMVSFADQTSLHLSTALAAVFLVATALAALGATIGHRVRLVDSAAHQ